MTQEEALKAFEAAMNAARSEIMRGQYDIVSGGMNSLLRVCPRLAAQQRYEMFTIQGVAACLSASNSNRSSRGRMTDFANAVRFFEEAQELVKRDTTPSLEVARSLTDYAICNLTIATYSGDVVARRLRDAAHALLVHALSHFEHIYAKRCAEALVVNGFRGFSLLEEREAEARQIMQATEGGLVKFRSANALSLGNLAKKPLDWLYGCRAIIRRPALAGDEMSCLAIMPDGSQRSFLVASPR